MAKPNIINRKTTEKWIKYVESIIPLSIVGYVKRGKYKGHARNRPYLWIRMLIKEIIKTMPKDVDGNMYMARSLAYILHSWYVTVHRCKIRDPRRPLKERRKVYKAWLAYVEAMSVLGMDERLDQECFPNQDMDLPFSRNAKNGTFI